MPGLHCHQGPVGTFAKLVAICILILPSLIKGQQQQQFYDHTFRKNGYANYPQFSQTGAEYNPPTKGADKSPIVVQHITPDDLPPGQYQILAMFGGNRKKKSINHYGANSNLHSGFMDRNDGNYQFVRPPGSHFDTTVSPYHNRRQFNQQNPYVSSLIFPNGNRDKRQPTAQTTGYGYG